MVNFEFFHIDSKKSDRSPAVLVQVALGSRAACTRMTRLVSLFNYQYEKIQNILGRQELLATSRFLCCSRAEEEEEEEEEVFRPRFWVFVNCALTLVPIGSIVFL